MNSFEGLMFAFLHRSLQTGMNIATIGVLFSTALSVVTGSQNPQLSGKRRFRAGPSTVR